MLEADSSDTFTNRELPPIESSEFLFDSTEIATANQVLLVGAGMRFADRDVLMLRWADRHTVNSEPLLPAALETLREAALTGMEHHLGRGLVAEHAEPHRRTYDVFYEASPCETHADFLQSLSLVSQLQGKVFMFDDFTPTPRQADAYCETAKTLQLAADKHFESLFYDEAVRAVSESDYEQSLRLSQLDPHIALAYLDKSFIVGRMIAAKNYSKISGDQGARRFCTWMLRQRQLIEEQL